MNIALCCGYYYPDTLGGTEAYVQMLGHNLEERGHHVTVVAPSTKNEGRKYTHEGLEVIRYPVVQDPNRREVRVASGPPKLGEWRKLLGRLNPDVVHMHSLTRGCSVSHAKVAVIHEIPLYVTIHVPEVTCPRGTMMRWGEVPCDGEVRPGRCGACVLQRQGLPKPVAWGASLLSLTGIGEVLPGRTGTALQRGPQIRQRKEHIQDWLKAAQHVVVVAGWLKDVLVRNGIPENHVTVSRHGLSDEMRSLQREAAQVCCSSDSDRALTVGFVGRFTEVKGAHVLVEAVRNLPANVDLALHLYGIAQTESDESYLQRLKHKAEGDSRIQFCGPLTEENRTDAFATFDVLAVPSLWFETGPYTVLEAFAADLPVLGSNHGGIEERVEDGKSGLLVPPGDVEQWESALLQLYEKKTQGNWDWTLPTPRSSREIAEEMEAMYQ